MDSIFTGYNAQQAILTKSESINSFTRGII